MKTCTIMKRALRGTALSALSITAMATPAFAQDEAEEDVIIVTGSRIVRPDLEASSPVAVIAGDDFKTFNSPSVESLLSENPQFLPENGPAVNNGSPGAATLNLRGLGDQRTLVLVDGKRMVSYDYNGIVDVNTIPTALIKRVDVLTGGASAVYGSDAVSGVVNFILDDEMTGLRLDGSTQITGHGDGEVYDLNVTGGIDLGGRGNIVASVGYLKRKLVYQGDRDYAKFVLDSGDLVSPGGSSTTFPTNFDNTFINDGNDYYQIGANDQLVPYYQPYNYGPPNYLTTPQERWLGTVLAKFDVTDSIELYGRGTYVSSKVNSQSAPTGTFGYTFDIYRENPYLTDQQEALFFNGLDQSVESTSVGIRRRIVESGGRTTTYDNEAWQGVVGLRGEFANGFSWDLFGQYAQTKRDIAYLNDITYGLVAQALDAVDDGNGNIVCRDPSNGCVPINLFTQDPIPQDALAFISATGKQKDKSQQYVFGASVSGDIGTLSPWSDSAAGFAIGAEYRKEKGVSTIDDLYASGELIGYGQGQTFPAFSYDVKEVYGELLVPLVTDRSLFQDLNLELGARYSDYSTVDSVFSWKAGANWTPVDGLRMRGMFQRAVRAPNLYELSAPTVAGIDNLGSDPCSGTNPVGNSTLTDLCIATGAPAGQIGQIAGPVSGQINAFYGGNLDLQEEKSDTFTLGFVATPRGIPGMSIAIDYYNIRIKNAIDVLAGSPQNVVDACYEIFQDASSPYCQAIIRNDLTGALSGGIDYGVQQFNFNSAVLKTKGVDVNFDYTRPFGDNNTIGFHLAGTYVDSYKKQGDTFVEPTECAGKFGFSCNIAPMPKWKHTATLTLGLGDITVAGRWRLIGSVSEDDGTDILRAKIGSYSYFDLTGSADIADAFTFRVGVNNLFDKDPPIVGAAAGGTSYNSANTFPTVYDPLGRTFFAGISAKF